MLSYEQLNVLPNEILGLYQRFEDSVLADIARRLAGLDMTSSAAWQVQRLNAAGGLYESILEKLSKLTGRSEAQLEALFRKAGVQSQKFDNRIYNAAGVELPLNFSPNSLRIMQNLAAQTSGLMRNLTATTALSSQAAFLDAADLAFLQASSGVMSYDEAIGSAVRSVADKGVEVVYPSGRHDQLDVAMRRAVLTGMNRATGDIQMQTMEELGVDLVAVSAHIGARPSHEIWQGKIYSRSGADKRYPDFVTETHYGEATGLHGINCRHTFYAFFDGISQEIYDQATRDDYASQFTTYNGQQISIYQATQMQRSIERRIRSLKRQANALQAAGLPNTRELLKVQRMQQRMNDFIRQTGLSRQRVREQISKVVITPIKQQPYMNPKGLDTTELYSKDGKWTPERQALHEKLIDEVFAGKTPVDQPLTYVMGGGTASGKGTVLKSGQVKLPDNAIHIDPDEFKVKLPEYQEMLARKDITASSFVHEESSHLTRLAKKRAVAGGYNLVVDTTGRGSMDDVRNRLLKLRAAGREVRGVYVTVDTETAIDRARLRGERSGRYVPEAFIRQAHSEISATFPQMIREGLFDELELYDNNGAGAKLIAFARGSSLTIYDQAAYQRFLDKAKGLSESFSIRQGGVSTGIAPVSLTRAKLMMQDPVKKILIEQAMAGVDLSDLVATGDFSRYEIANIRGAALTLQKAEGLVSAAAVDPVVVTRAVRVNTIEAEDVFQIAQTKEALSLREAVRTIGDVHGFPDHIRAKSLPIRRSPTKSTLGSYMSSNFMGAPVPVKIQISTTGSRIHLTVAHEIGHFLDHVGFERLPEGTFWSSHKWSNLTGAVNRYGAKIVELAKNSDWFAVAKDRLLATANPNTPAISIARYLDYLQSPEELFARAYAQFIAKKSADPYMLAELKLLQQSDNLHFPLQWSDNDFQPIFDAFDAMFKELGWSK